MGSCPACGWTVIKEARFCDSCGRPIELESGQRPDGIATKEEVAKRVGAASVDRKRTDKRIPSVCALLALLPLASYPLIVLIIMIRPLLGYNDFDIFRAMYVIGRPLALFASAVTLGLMVYLLLERMNAHIKREERLRAGLISYLRLASAEAGEERTILDSLLRLSSYDGQARVYEKNLDGGKWGLAVFAVFFAMAVPSLISGVQYMNDDSYRWTYLLSLMTGLLSSLVSIATIIILAYIAAHLMRTINTHDLRWNAFVSSLEPSMRVIGKELKLPAPVRIQKERSLILYAILTLVTFGLFAVYWLYVLIKDPNDHFDGHDLVEPEILSAIG
ncbi:MAG: DUF4234 domain-containing protein [Methanobacteriota archaeon]|nr:MAG: DUF4234 domain-containing protein [Euryarchaeota archaeon]